MVQRTKVFGLFLTCSLLLLSACSSNDTSKTTEGESDDGETIAEKTIAGSFKGAIDAVRSPFVDLNFTRDEIPETLQKISGNPYTPPAPLQCKVMKKEIEELDVALGPDMAQGSKSKGTALLSEDTDYVQEGANMIQDSAIGFVAGKTSIIPFRGIVRKITGAEQHSRDLAHAYESGKLRRAYLKGLTLALKCDKKSKNLPQLASNTKN